MIGVEKQNIVYFPTGKHSLEVQRLNTATCETETIKRLPFEPRCLVAQNGWVCCGGETGEFTAIRVNEGTDSPGDALDALLNLNPDDRLPIDLDPARATAEALYSSLARARSYKSILARSKTFGKERVNCITLWFPPTIVQPHEGSYDQPVAVLSNNDKSVAVVSLWEQEAVDEIDYPDCVNRAVISPDGRYLIAVSDDPYLYIHERVRKTRGFDLLQIVDQPAYEWRQCGKIHLKSQSKEDRSDNRGSFAACFSGNGRYLAVGTQYGYISVFDVAAFAVPDMDPLLTTFTSSRPNADYGAVRDMAFAPGSVDLLAWTEDRGYVGVADIRSGFISRQILDLGKRDDYEHISISDGGSIDPRLIEHRSNRNDNLLSNIASTLDLSPEARLGRRSETRDSADRYHVPLTQGETAVLEALQEQRRRRERAQSGSGTGSGGNTVGTGFRSSWADRNTRPSAFSSETARSRERAASVARTVSDLLGNLREQRDPRERSRDFPREDSNDNNNASGANTATNNNNTTSDSTRDDSHMDWQSNRRRPIAPPSSFPTWGRTAGTAGSGATPGSSARGSASAGSAAAAPAATTTSGGNTTNTSDRNEQQQQRRATGWASVEALYNLAFEGTLPIPYESLRSAVTGESEVTRRRDRAAYLMREWDDSPARRVLGMGGLFRREPDPHDTAGIAWSEDGQFLFVGAEDGIYEFEVNLFGRRVFPSITFR